MEVRTSSTLHTHRAQLTFHPGICAGKHAIAEYLAQHQGFQLLELKTKVHASEGPGEDLLLQAADSQWKSSTPSANLVFDDVDALLEFVTKKWQDRWVTTDICDATTLERLLIRPFFLLVSVDAPVSLRWKRFSDRYDSKTKSHDSCVEEKPRLTLLQMPKKTIGPP